MEKGNQRFENLWENFDNTNSITLNAYVPLWDGGQRTARIQAEKLDLIRRELDIEEEKEEGEGKSEQGTGDGENSDTKGEG